LGLCFDQCVNFYYLNNYCLYTWYILSFHERSEQTKWVNVVSGMVENLHRKNFSPARIGVWGCCLSVHPSVHPSLCLCDFVK
jgi:hypothetical protein